MQHHGFSESDSEAREIAPYRSLSPLALVSLVLGMASILAVGTPFLWVIPVLAVGFAIWALRDLQRNGASRFGRKAALVGMLLALFFGGFATTRVLVDRALHRRQARQVAELWFEAISDQRSADAYLWMMDPVTRFARKGEGDHGLTEDVAQEMAERFREPPYSTLITAAPDFEASYVSCELNARLGKSRVLQLRYDIYWSGQNKRPTELIVDLKLFSDPPSLSRRDRWQVRGVGPVQKR